MLSRRFCMAIPTAASRAGDSPHGVCLQYSSLSALPPAVWPSSIGVIYETGAPDCGYDPSQNTATGTGSCTSACKIVFAVVDI